MSKWLWRFGCGVEDIQGFSTIVSPCTFGTGLWKAISSNSPLFQPRLSFSVNDGLIARFWKDDWNQEAPLQVTHPNLFSIARLDEGQVSDHLVQVDSRYCWDLNLTRRRLSDIQITEATELLEILPEFRSSDDSDVRRWNLNEQHYTVKSLCKILQKRRGNALEIGFPNFLKAKVWNDIMPTKVSIVLWLILLDKLPVTKNLQSMYHLASRCPLCCDDEETTFHLFLHCPFSLSIWALFSTAFGSQPLVRNSFLQQWDSWRSARFSLQSITIWQHTFHVVIWGIWRERNNRIFNNKNCSLDQAKCDIMIFIWCLVFGKPSMKDIRFDSFMADLSRWCPCSRIGIVVLCESFGGSSPLLS